MEWLKMRGWAWLKRVSVAIGLLSVAAALLIWTSWHSDFENGLYNLGYGELSKDSLVLATTAAAMLENNQVTDAIASYRSLLKRDPKNVASATNLSIALVSRIKDQVKVVSDLSANKNDLEEAKSAQEVLAQYFSEADAAIENAMQLPTTNSAIYQLAVELAMLRMEGVPKAQSDASMKKLLNQIAEFNQKSPGDPYLATAMSDIVDQMAFANANDRRESVTQAVGALRSALKKYPRNLYVLNRLTSLLIAHEDKSALELIDLMIPLCRPLGIEGDENEVIAILNEAKGGAADDSDLAMALVEQSQNLIVRTSAFRADERVTRPNTLALVDMSDIRQSIQLLVDNRQQDSTEKIPKIRDQQLLDGSSKEIAAQTLAWFDWNIDLEPELIWVFEETLSMGSLRSDGSANIDVLQTLSVPKGVHTLRTIDLFEVQFPSRPQRDYQRRQKELGGSLSEEAVQQTVDRRADTLRDIVLIGSNGVQLVTLTETGESDDGNRESRSPASHFTWRLVEEKTGLESISTAEDCRPIDWDADGDLDLVIVSKGQIVLMQNRGNRTFDNVNTFSVIPDETYSVRAICVCDYDRDQDLDILIASQSEKPMAVLENILHGQFRFRDLDGDWGKLAGAKSLAVAELDGNVSWDWIAANENRVEALYTSTTGIGLCRPRIPVSYPQEEVNHVSVADLNNDGAPDVIFSTASQASVLWNTSTHKFSSTSTSLFAKNQAVGSLSITDLGQDGLLDMAAIVGGAIHIGSVENVKQNGYTQVRVKGINDENGGGRVNQYAIGSLIELFTPDRYQAQIVSDDFCHFGIGASDSPQNLRIVFTNGLTQNVLKPETNKVVEERQILKGSCPFAYGWDGEKWSLITDLLWNAPLGLQVARGKPLQDRRWEHLLIPGKFMQPREGGYELRITEELWETAYFDQIELVAIDHPLGTEIYSNEKVGPPSIAEPKVWLVEERKSIASVVDSQGRNWTEELSKVDQRHAIPFEKRICQGNVSKHFLELNLSGIENVDAGQLYLTGWIFPTDTSLNMGLDQNPDVDHPVPPSLWSVDQRGEFQCVQPFMGFPGGKPKTIVIPLKNVFQSDDHRLRIETSCEIYWDEMFFAHGVENDERLSVETLTIHHATLGYRGFSAIQPRRLDQHHDYDYQQLSVDAVWPPMDGLFTDYGDVRSLLLEDDDRLVVMGSGDEMQLRFSFEDPFAVKEGMQRDFILSNIGWDKDADLNTLEGQSSLPLPFAAMQKYPPPFQQVELADAVYRLNAPTMHRKQDYYRFWHR